MMTKTYESVTSQQYNEGSSCVCPCCGRVNYFLVPLSNVSLRYQCWYCNNDEYHPSVIHRNEKINELKEEIKRLKEKLADTFLNQID